jgi:lipid II isoglutaminyl synthase (glutamine-hydrolysing)
MRSTVGIGLLLPDLLGTYGDSGNALVLAQRLRWRGIAAEVVHCTADRPAPSSCEVYLLGGGEDVAQVAAVEWLRGQPGLLAALAGPAVTVAVCAGLQLLGTSFADGAGRTHRGAGLVDLSTTRLRRRAVGDLVTSATADGLGQLRGFENHRGGTRLGPGLTPLGLVRSGVGNGTAGSGDGVHTDRLVGTYMHGPVLARNPALADHVLERAVGGPLPELEPDSSRSCRVSADSCGGR